jgi:hypothetical protein
MAAPKKLAEFILVALVSLMIGYGTGTVLTERSHMITPETTIALEWSDGIIDDPPMGAHIYLEPHMDGKSVRLIVHIGRGEPAFFQESHNGEIDVVADAKTAAEKWSVAQWTAEGLHLGQDGNKTRHFIPRASIKPIEP